MENYAKFVVAKEILARAMAIACTNGFDANDPMIRQLLDDKKELQKFNLEVVDKIINLYSQVINL